MAIFKMFAWCSFSMYFWCVIGACLVFVWCMFGVYFVYVNTCLLSVHCILAVCLLPARCGMAAYWVRACCMLAASIVAYINFPPKLGSTRVYCPGQGVWYQGASNSKGLFITIYFQLLKMNISRLVSPLLCGCLCTLCLMRSSQLLDTAFKLSSMWVLSYSIRTTKGLLGIYWQGTAVCNPIVGQWRVEHWNTNNQGEQVASQNLQSGV